MSDTALEVGRLYEPIKKIADVVTASQGDLFVRLPALLGYFPMSATRLNGEAANHASEYKPLSMTGTVMQGYDGNAYRKTGSGTNYLYASSYGVLSGTETWVDPAIRGWTIGGWLRPDATPAATQGVVSRDGLITDRGYFLAWDTDNSYRGGVSGTGAAPRTINSAPQTVGNWAFVAVRFIPSVEIAIIVNQAKATNSLAIPTSTFATIGNFEVGRYNANNNNIFSGNVRDVFICQSALSDNVLSDLYNSSKP